MLTISDVSNDLKVSKSTVIRMIKSNSIPFVDLSSKSSRKSIYRFDECEYRAWKSSLQQGYHKSDRTKKRRRKKSAVSFFEV